MPAGSPLTRLTTMPLRQRAVVAASLVVALVALVIATNLDRTPGSDPLHPSQRATVDALAEDGRCAQLRVVLDDARVERSVPFADRARQADALIDYTLDAMDRAGCPD